MPSQRSVSSSSTYGTSHSRNHEVLSGDNRELVVFVRLETGASLTALTYGGTALTAISGAEADHWNGNWFRAYALDDPPVGTAALAATLGSAGQCFLFAISYSDAGAIGTPTVLAQPGTSTVSRSVTAAPADAVVSCLSVRHWEPPTVTATGDQTVRASSPPGDAMLFLADSPGGDPAVHSYTLGSAYISGFIAFSIADASESGGVQLSEPVGLVEGDAVAAAGVVVRVSATANLAEADTVAAQQIVRVHAPAPFAESSSVSMAAQVRAHSAAAYADGESADAPGAARVVSQAALTEGDVASEPDVVIWIDADADLAEGEVLAATGAGGVIISEPVALSDGDVLAVAGRVVVVVPPVVMVDGDALDAGGTSLPPGAVSAPAHFTEGEALATGVPHVTVYAAAHFIDGESLSAGGSASGPSVVISEPVAMRDGESADVAGTRVNVYHPAAFVEADTVVMVLVGARYLTGTLSAYTPLSARLTTHTPLTATLTAEPEAP